MARYLRILLFYFLFSLLCFAQTDQIQFEHLSVEEGLSATTVMAILQDSRGFLWFGTYDGLNRYDGYSFTTYIHNSDDSTTISSNSIRALCEDGEGNIWVGTWNNGLNKFNRNTGKFTRYVNSERDTESISNNEILSVHCSKSNQVWIGTADGLNKLDKNNNRFIRFKNDSLNPESISGNIVNCIYEDKKGILWIGTSNGLNKFSEKDNKFIRYVNSSSNPRSINHNKVICLIEDKDGFLWVGTHGGGLNILNPETENFTHYRLNSSNPFSISDDYIYALLEDSRGSIWIGTYQGGLNRFDKQKNRFYRYIPELDNPFSLNDNGVFALCEDRSGIIWIGTWVGGLNKYDPGKKKFKHYCQIADDPESINSNKIRSFCEDNYGSIWIGTEDAGLNILKRDSDKFIHYISKPSNTKGLSNNIVYSICKDNFNNLWIGTDGGGLNKLNLTTKKFTHFTHDPNNTNSISEDRISLVFKDNSGVLWIGTSEGGLNTFDIKSEKFTRLSRNPDDKSGIGSEKVYSVYEDRRGVLWIGTHGGGLCRYDKKKKQFIYYQNRPGDSTSLSNNVVSCVYEDNAGILWVGTEDGLNKFDRENEIFYSYKKSDGLPNNMILGILEDDYGNLWLSTNKGISKFNPTNFTFRNYDENDGLQGNEFNQWAYYKCRNGEMLFGGSNGFNIFHPDSIRDNTYIPPVVITEFQLLHNTITAGFNKSINRTILTNSISETSEIQLAHDDNVISFEFAALDFHIPGKNKYAHKLEGFDDDWNYTNADRRFATYTNLDPGEYTFRVKGSNNDGIWNEDGAFLRIIINPPWWKNWWAYILYGIILASIFYSSTRFYLNRQRLKQQLILEHEHSEKLEEVDQMKSRFFTNISHEFRTPLTLILGPSESIAINSSREEIRKHANTINKNANRLLDLINQLLDISKLEAGKLELKASKYNIVPFIKGVAMSFESFAEKKDITLRVKSDKDDIELYFDKEKMEKVFTNLISNAFKFTPEGGSIIVSIKETEHNSVEIKIKDSGIGIPEKEIPMLFDRFYQVDSPRSKTHGGSGIGLALSKELVELHKGVIKVESKLEKWTEVTVILLLGKDHLQENEIVESIVPTKKKKVVVDNNSEWDSLLLEKSSSEIFDKDKIIILIVEDNTDVREYVKDSLESDYYIEEAANGEQGVRKAKAIIPDLIISDVMMPKMDGNELARKLKNDEPTSHIPIILLTAKTEQESKLEGLETGADAYLTKPFDTKELQIRIKNLINVRRKLQKKYGGGKIIKVKDDDKKISNLDEQFMIKIMKVIENHISEEEFNIEDFGSEVGMSRMQIHRKLKALTGQSATYYIRSVKLNKAKEKLEKHGATISEIAYSLGFSSPAYFSRCFKEQYGFPPSELVD